MRVNLVRLNTPTSLTGRVFTRESFKHVPDIIAVIPQLETPAEEAPTLNMENWLGVINNPSFDDNWFYGEFLLLEKYPKEILTGMSIGLNGTGMINEDKIIQDYEVQSVSLLPTTEHNQETKINL